MAWATANATMRIIAHEASASDRHVRGREVDVAERLSALGHKVVDTDYGGFSQVEASGEQHWRADRIQEVLESDDAEVLFVVGTDESQGEFYPQFDHIILLSAPRDVVVQRVVSRSNNPFGKTQEQLAKILEDMEMYEPLIPRTADHEIDTSVPVEDVVEEILRVINTPVPR